CPTICRSCSNISATGISRRRAICWPIARKSSPPSVVRSSRDAADTPPSSKHCWSWPANNPSTAPRSHRSTSGPKLSTTIGPSNPPLPMPRRGKPDDRKGDRHALQHVRQHVAVRSVPLYLPRGAADRQSHPLRSRALHLEKRFLTDAAEARASAGLQPLSLWCYRRDPRPFRRLPRTALGYRLGAVADSASIARYGGGGHCRTRGDRRPDNPHPPTAR